MRKWRRSYGGGVKEESRKTGKRAQENGKEKREKIKKQRKKEDDAELADRMRFELMNACALPDFESGAFGHSATCPREPIISVFPKGAKGILRIDFG